MIKIDISGRPPLELKHLVRDYIADTLELLLNPKRLAAPLRV